MTTESAIWTPQTIVWLREIAHVLAIPLPEEAWPASITFEEAALSMVCDEMHSVSSQHPLLGQIDVMYGYNPILGMAMLITGEKVFGSIAIEKDRGILQINLTTNSVPITMTSVEINSKGELVHAKILVLKGELEFGDDKEPPASLALIELLFKNMPSLRRALRHSQDMDTAKFRDALLQYWEWALGDIVGTLRDFHQKTSVDWFKLVENVMVAGITDIPEVDMMVAAGLFTAMLPVEDWFDPNSTMPDEATYRHYALAAAYHMVPTWGPLPIRCIHWAIHLITFGRVQHPRTINGYRNNLLKMVGVT